jgi:O-methyltransferase involved in polyketide biosynthesis
MIEKIKADVSGTAFVVNYSRARLVNISQDRYAHLWVTPEAIALWEDLAHKVYPHDDLNLSLRNRFYLEHLNRFIDANKNCILISLGAGFDNYPFLVEADCRWIECDLPNIVAFKKSKVEQWIKDKKLPKRNIEFISVDLTKENQRIQLKQALKKAIDHNPSFVMMEGLSYYLSREVLSDIFKIFTEIQATGSLVAFDYWEPDALEYPVMARLKEYLNKKFGHSGEDWNLFDKTYIKGREGFMEIESADIATLELTYADTRVMQGRDHKIPVHFSVLKRL